MKSQHEVKLTGMINGMPAKTHQAGLCTSFVGDSTDIKGYFKVERGDEAGSPILHTYKGKYQLIWNKSGYFEPKLPVDGIKIHVMLKAVVGKIIYWA